MSTGLPSFRYHPDPVFTRSVQPSDVRCICCDLQRGFIYRGPVYAIGSYNGQICPWCIADGTAHRKLNCTFQDDYGVRDVPTEVVEEVTQRTPGFSGWQQEQWWTHCNDAAAFLGDAQQVRPQNEDLEQLIEVLLEDSGFSEKEWGHYFVNPGNGTGVTVYVFRCLHCGKMGGNWDAD